jgi:hypothetical protein
MDEFLQSFLGSPTAGLIGALGQGVLTERGIKDIGQARQEAMRALTGAPDFPQIEGGLMGQVQRGAQFKPFTVTTPTGASATLSPTGMQAQISPEEAALQGSLTGFGQYAFDLLGDPAQREEEQSAVIGMLTQAPSQRAAREQELYNRFEGMQQPARERAALELEERLLSQGRSGVRTAAYGGTPEQLAAQKAIEEQRAANAITAIEQARLEQALGSQQTLQGLQEFRGRMGLLGELGLAAIPTAYTPQTELLRSLTPQIQTAQLATDLQRTGLGLEAALGEAAIESQLGFEALRNALRQQQYQGLFDLLRGEQERQSGQTADNAVITRNPQTGQLQLGGALGDIENALARARAVFE